MQSVKATFTRWLPRNYNVSIFPRPRETALWALAKSERDNEPSERETANRESNFAKTGKL